MLDSFAPSEGAAPARARLQSDAPHLSLDGQWRFRLSPTADAPVDFVADAATSAGWDAITVPGHWQFQGENALTPDAAWGRPAYTNVRFPFPVDPPFVPDDNPTGDHVLEFDLPADWPAGETLLRFDGVDNHVRVWVNGTEVGWSTGSRLQTEFPVGSLLHPGANTLAVRVHQWSASSYLEDQDMWWVSGIFRSVTLFSRPAGGVDDVFVHATGSGELRVETVAGARLSVPELGLVDVDAAETFQLDVEPWTAETPRLYEATVSTAAETVSLRIGFRTVSTEGGVFTVNGAPIVFRGVNRHEWDPTHGRAVPADVMLEDVRIMKRLGVNAVRTSHYPPHPDFLDLCDEHGLYVVLECDLETHGFFFADWRHNPSDDPRWQDAYLDRMSRTLERDKNHASVIMWSLGNEAGVGQNLHAMADLVHARDSSRPVHYEGDWDSTYVDVYSRMYAPHDEVNSIGQGIEGVTVDPAADAHRRTLPFVLCEYVHAMGNGPGGVVEYQRLIDTYPRLAGGFVWEWIDQAVQAPHPQGGTYWAYGGDMGEPLHDGDFICDGLLFPDRTLSPGALEFKAAASPVLVEVQGATVTVTNRYDHVGLDDLRFEVVVNAGDAYELDLLPVLPHASTTVTVPDAAPSDVVTVRALTRVATALVPAGHEVAFGQSVPEPDAFVWTASGTDGTAPDETWFDPTTGRLLRIGDVEVEGPQLDLWRAPTDNDNGEHGVNVSKQWRSVGLDRLQHRVVSRERTDAAFTVVVRSAPAAADCGYTTTYRWSTVDAGLQLLAEFQPWGTWPCVLPRLGLRMSLPGDVDRVEWYGDGPGEAYADTRAAVRLGAWTSSVEELQTPYVFPQENGARSNVQRATLTGLATSIAVDSASGFQLTVRPWTSEDLDAATHAVDLTARDRVYVNLDVGQNGVGTAACGPGVLPGHQLWAGTALLALTFREVSA